MEEEYDISQMVDKITTIIEGQKTHIITCSLSGILACIFVMEGITKQEFIHLLSMSYDNFLKGYLDERN